MIKAKRRPAGDCRKRRRKSWCDRQRLITIMRCSNDRHDRRERRLADFINTYSYGERLEMLKGLTRYKFIVEAWTKEDSVQPSKCQS